MDRQKSEGLKEVAVETFNLTTDPEKVYDRDIKHQFYGLPAAQFRIMD
jgi:hypothetical protein